MGECDFVELERFLGETVKSFFADRVVNGDARRVPPPQQVTAQIVSMFRDSRCCDRERYLGQLLGKLDEVNRKRDELAEDLEAIRIGNHRDLMAVKFDNEKLITARSELESKYSIKAAKRERIEKMSMARLRQKESVVAGIPDVLDATISVNMEVKKDLARLKLAARRMGRGQMEIIARAKELCTAHLQSFIDEIAYNCRNVRDRRTADLAAAITAEREEQRRLEGVSEEVLNAIMSVTPVNGKLPEVTVKEFPYKIAELTEFIGNVLEMERVRTIEALKREIAAEMADVTFGKHENVEDAVERYVDGKVLAKKNECERVLKKGENQERNLRNRLDDVIHNIRRLQSCVMDEPPDEAREKQKVWTEQKSRLDETMAALEKERQTHSALFAASSSIVNELGSEEEEYDQ